MLGSYREPVGGMCAVVATPGLYYGVSRMFSVFVEQYGIEMHIFDTVESAESWLRGESPPPEAG